MQHRNRWYESTGVESSYDVILEGLYTLEAYERLSPYQPLRALGGNISFWDRVGRATDIVKKEFESKEAPLYLLSIFSRIMYLTDDVLMYSWKHLYSKLVQLLYEHNILKHDTLVNINGFVIDKVLFMEEDDGLFLHFMESNNIQGRLDRDIREVNYCRVGLDLISGSFETKYAMWILLVDFALSGTSLTSSLKRLIRLKEYTGNKNVTIVVLIQVITEDALKKLKKELGSNLDKEVRIFYSIYIPTELTLKDCSRSLLFKDINGISCKDVKEFLHEFEDVFINSYCKNRRKELHCETILNLKEKLNIQSIALGFKESGLLLVSPHNTPNNSVPPIWLRTNKYSGLYPRRFSRIRYRGGMCKRLDNKLKGA